MEFEHVGSKCAHHECQKQDFLPIKCQECKLTYCNIHANYNKHDCIGSLKRDIISYACPLCDVSIKLSKADNADEKWQEHYANTCPHGPNGSSGGSNNINPTNNSTNTTNKIEHTNTPISTNTNKCARVDCRVGTLGPGNSMKCSKCSQLVCISHRLPEEHTCMSTGRGGGTSSDVLEKRLAAMNKTNTSGNTSGNSTSNNTVTNNKNSTKQQPNKSKNKIWNNNKNKNYNNNTAASTADRRRKNITKIVFVNGMSILYTIPPGDTKTIIHGPISFSIKNNNGKEVITVLRPPNMPLRCIDGDIYIDYEPNVEYETGSGSGLGSGSFPAIPTSNPTATTNSNNTSTNTNNVNTNNANTTTNTNSTNTTVTNREVCPQCSERFGDVMLLIAHVEAKHSNGGNTGSSNGGNNSTSNGNENKECLVM